MDRLFRQALTLTALRGARDKVLANHGCAGVDGQTVEDFASLGDVAMRLLAAEVIGGQYQPSPLRRIWLPREGKAPRGLAVPVVRDRVLQTSVATALNPAAEASAEDCSFGYRRGRSVQQAVARVESLLRDGYQWIVEADIDSFFDHIDHPLLLARLDRLCPGEPLLLKLVRMWLSCPIADGDAPLAPRSAGVPQGSPLSPLLANLYLDDFDELLIDANHKLVRFADDFVILARNRERAEAALALSREVVENLALRLNPIKTRIVHRDQGFEFLGWNFVRTLAVPRQREPDVRASMDRPTALPARAEAHAEAALPTDLPTPEADLADGSGTDDDPSLPALAPLQRTLYLVDPQAELGVDNARLVVRKAGRPLLAVSALNVDQVMVFGPVQVSTQALQLVARSGGAISFLSQLGRYYGRFDGADGSALGLLEAQFERARDPNFALELARHLIFTKLRNSATVLARALRHQSGEQLKQDAIAQAPARLRELADGAQRSANLAALRGTEGAAAALYFRVLQATVPPAWAFHCRKARPAPDAVNALLSFGYSLLYQAVAGLLRARGLHAHLGLFHAHGGSHMALSSDLMEPYRAYAVDTVVLRLIRRNTLQPDCGQLDGDTFVLNTATTRAFIHAFETRVNTVIQHPQTGEPMDLRRLIDADVRQLAQVLRANTPRDFWPAQWN